MAKANIPAALTEEQLAALRVQLFKDKAKLEADLGDLGGKKVEKETLTWNIPNPAARRTMTTRPRCRNFLTGYH
jgi:hypothetical protein